MADQSSTADTEMSFTPGLLPRLAATPKHKLLQSPASYVPPKHIDRRSELLTSSNQGETSQCVAYALAGWIEHYKWKYEGIAAQIDPAPIYQHAKQIDGYPNGEGTTLEAGLQSAQELGLISAVAQGSIREVTTPLEVRQALHRYGVVLAAFNATEAWSFPSATGWIKPEGSPLGGHAVLLCGYSDLDDEDNSPFFALQNSWGDIGWRGFVRMSPQQFVTEFQYGLTWEFSAS